MYKFSYAEILDESCTLNRERERFALDHAVELLTRANAAGPGSEEMTNALAFVQKLWGFFISDLSDPHNELPQQVRADLASLGLWVIQEADQILTARSGDLAGLISVNQAIRDGLK